MNDLPTEIQVWKSYPELHHTGTWSTERYPAEAVTYVRKEDAEAAQALVVERAAEILARRAGAAKLVGWDAEERKYRELEKDIRALADTSGVEALAALRAERDALRAAVEGLIAVLDRNDKKGPIPNVEMMFCWLAAQDVRAAFRKIAPKGEAT